WPRSTNSCCAPRRGSPTRWQKPRPCNSTWITGGTGTRGRNVSPLAPLGRGVEGEGGERPMVLTLTLALTLSPWHSEGERVRARVRERRKHPSPLSPAGREAFIA